MKEKSQKETQITKSITKLKFYNTASKYCERLCNNSLKLFFFFFHSVNSVSLFLLLKNVLFDVFNDI